MAEKVVILGTAHRLREPGKCSPDKRLRECVYSREIVEGIRHRLEASGVKTFVDYTALDLPKTMQTPSVRLERQRELALRVNEVNSVCDRYGKGNCCYVSIHVNALGNDGQWHSANGWQVCVSPQSSKNAKVLADYLFDTAWNFGLRMRQPMRTQKYWEQGLYVLDRTHCPAVLTENLFQDNQKDVDYLLSDFGRSSIIKLHWEGILRYLDYLNNKK